MSQPSHAIPAKRIAFIQAGWHRDIVAQCRLSFIAEMATLGFAESDIDVIDVRRCL